ncbi:hypothetical protein B0H13DRAFT_1920958 [Mycena leptocephala]|nr:hypothetical protein B0H13DRAFT_1920958 [Mycena leptocephala]
MADEPAHNKYVLYPIQEQKLWDMYKTAEARFWTAEDFLFPPKETLDHTRIKHVIPIMQAILCDILLQHDGTLDVLSTKTSQQEAKIFLNYQSMMCCSYSYHSSIHDLVSKAESLRSADARKSWVDTYKGDVGVFAIAAACAETIFLSSFHALADTANVPRIAEIASNIRLDQEITTTFLVHMCFERADDSFLPVIERTIQGALELELSLIKDVVETQDIYDHMATNTKTTAASLLQRFETAHHHKQRSTNAHSERRSTKLTAPVTRQTRPSIPPRLTFEEDF